MPGLIYAHTHSGQILERGCGDCLTLEGWIVGASNGSQCPAFREVCILFRDGYA
jgi:hypothetical protein